MTIAQGVKPITNDGKNGIPCPTCRKGFLTITKDSRPRMYDGELVTMRRKECDNCGTRTTTLELPESALAAWRSAPLKALILRLIDEI